VFVSWPSAASATGPVTRGCAVSCLRQAISPHAGTAGAAGTNGCSASGSPSKPTEHCTCLQRHPLDMPRLPSPSAWQAGTRQQLPHATAPRRCQLLSASQKRWALPSRAAALQRPGPVAAAVIMPSLYQAAQHSNRHAETDHAIPGPCSTPRHAKTHQHPSPGPAVTTPPATHHHTPS